MKILQEKRKLVNIVGAIFILLLSGCVSSLPTPQKMLTQAASNQSGCETKVVLYERIIRNNDNLYKTYENGKMYSNSGQVTQAIDGIKIAAPNCLFNHYAHHADSLINSVITLQSREDPRALELFDVLLQNMKNSPQAYKKETNSYSDWYMKGLFARLSEILSSAQANKLFAVATSKTILSKKDVTLIREEGSKGIYTIAAQISEKSRLEFIAKQSAESKVNANSPNTSTWIAALGGVASVAGAVDSRNSAAYSKLGAELMRDAAKKEKNSETAKGYSDVANSVDKRTQNSFSCGFKIKTLGDATRMCQCQKGKMTQKSNHVYCKTSAESEWGCTRFDDGKVQCGVR